MKSNEEIYNDYRRLSDNRQDGLEEIKADIRAFFEPNDTYSSPLANNHGQIAANEYIEFAHGEIFGPGWITASGDEKKAKEREKVLDYMCGVLYSSNFYTESIKLLKEGVLYKKGLIQPTWSGGICFETIINKNIIVSPGFSMATKRAYASRWIGQADICGTYEGVVVDELQMQLDADQIEYEVVDCIIPLDKEKDRKRISDGYMFKKVTLLIKDDMPHELTNPNEGTALYGTFPIMEYCPQYNQSLAAIALVKSVNADGYEVLIHKQARKSLNPPHSISQQLYESGAFDLGEGGLVPLMNYEREVKPIETAQKSNLSGDDVKRQEAVIDRVFKIDLINRAKLTNMSQFEAASNYLNALKAIAPAATDLIYKVPVYILERVHKLLIKNDKKYKELALAAGDIDWKMSGWADKIKKLEKAIGVGRVAQGAAPFIQADPASAQALKGEEAVRILAECWRTPDVAASEEEINEERKEMEEAAQQQQEAAQAQQEAEITKTQAETEQLQNPTQ